MPFPVLPALHLEKGRVRELPRDPPTQAIASTARRFGEAVLVDADGLARNQADLEVLSNAARNRIVWMDAGSRTVADVSDLFIAGASRVTVRWNTLADTAELEEAVEIAEALYLGVEVGPAFVQNPRDRIPAAKLAEVAGRIGVPVVVIDLAAREAPTPNVLSLAASFRAAPELWYMGPVRRASVLPLEEQGFAGAIVPVEEALPPEDPA